MNSKGKKEDPKPPKQQSKFKRLRGRERREENKGEGGVAIVGIAPGRKRGSQDMELEGDDMNKKQCVDKEDGQAVDSTSESAGLPGQPCEPQ